MGLDPYTALMIGQLGSAGISGLLADDGQERQSFEGTGADPVSWLSDVRATTSNLLNSARNRANESFDVGGFPIDLNPQTMQPNNSPFLDFNSPELPFALSSPRTMPMPVSRKGFDIGAVGTGAYQPPPKASASARAPLTGTHVERFNQLRERGQGATATTPASAPSGDHASRIAFAQQNATTPTQPMATDAPMEIPSQVQGQAAARLLLHALQGTS